MNVAVVSPEEVLFEGEATQVITRTTEGDVRSSPATAVPRDARRERDRAYLPDGRVEHFNVPGGFVEVSNDTVSILVS